MAPSKDNFDDISRTSFGYVYYNVFLPSKLPFADDTSQKNEMTLLEFVQQSLQRFILNRRDEEAVKAGISVMKSIRASRNSQGHLKDTGVREVFKGLSRKNPTAALQITEQNAGVLLERNATSVCFELFELLPTSEAAVASQGRLIRYFPATAVEIDLAEFGSDAFQTVMTQTLTKMSQQMLRKTTQVAKEKPEKEYDQAAADPTIVTELLASMLRGCGKEIAAQQICKNTREDVIGKDGKSPWRRSGVWLFVRVALQLSMTRHSRKDDNTYKEFMVFLMAQILHAASQQQKMPSDVLHTMLMKVARRLSKLQSPSDGSWLLDIRRITSQAADILEKRWRFIISRAEPPFNLIDMSKFDAKENIDFMLNDMDMFLQAIDQRKSVVRVSRFTALSQINTLSLNQLPSVEDWNQNDLAFNLIQIESWVADNLQTWIDNNMGKSDNAVRDLKQLVEGYHSKAAGYYSERPEGASRMLLTIGQLWHAADIAAIQELPLLAEYEPEIPTMVFQALLLGSKQEMQRLQSLEKYISDRTRSAKELDRPSIFRSFGQPGSFAVEFFGMSTRHQHIKYEIEAQAATQRQEKREEFRKAKAEYVNLMQKHANSECDVSTKRDGGTIYLHPPSCRRCGFESKAKALAVFIHEWPLPQNDLEAQATVVEMASPVTFSEWRDLTIYVINDVLLCQPTNPSASRTSLPLKSYQPLKPWHTTKGHYRIHLRSADKPNTVIHRRALPVGQHVESDVCFNSGLMYRYYDDSLNAFSDKMTASTSLSELCTFRLPERAQALNRFLQRTWEHPDGQTPNEVIASQSECPDWMPRSEYKALAGMIYGHKIQWMNILTQLAMPKIDFTRAETATFLLQMSLQAGPESSRTARSTHMRLCDREFGFQMLRSLTSSIVRVEENWESHMALWSFTFLAARVLSLVADDLAQSFLDLLERCRQISYTWLTKLLKRVELTSDAEQRKEFLEAALSIALTCIDTFNLYNDHLYRTLQSARQASILVECSVIVNEIASPDSWGHHPLRGVMFDRWRLIMHRARPILADQVLSGNSFLSDAAKRRWQYFKPTSPWTTSTGTDCWYQTKMDLLTVHINILTGELLANGLPLSRLPTNYETHDDYLRLFRDQVLNVMPSISPGMTFCTTQLLHGHTVHFGWQGQDLLIRLEKEGLSFDYIPPRVFVNSLPDSLAHDHVHWYNNNTGIVEFYTLGNHFPAETSPWRLERHDMSWNLYGPEKSVLLVPSSEPAQRISKIFRNVEVPLRIHLLYDSEKGLLDIKVPRLGLEFFVRGGESIIRSRQFRDMHIDEDQSLGTLVGLGSKFILRNDQSPPTRLLIIPEGEVVINRQGGDMVHDHIVVSLCHGTARRVQAYRIDELLGRLVANTKLESKLYLAYLHALTSFYLPDPFLGRRGTEEALRILTSASVRTPAALSPTACIILNLIAGLAPSRHYVPGHQRVMQNVIWSPQLSLPTQEDRFFKIVDNIFQRCSEIEFLFPKVGDQSTRTSHTTMDLVRRAISRNGVRSVSEFVTEDYCRSHDEVYKPRDKSMSDRAIRTMEIAHRAFHGQQGLMEPVEGGFALNLYSMMSIGRLSNHGSAPSKREMEYDSIWLQKPSSFMSSYWCQLHHAFQDNPCWLNKMELTVWISTIAYSTEHDMQVTQALLNLALCPSVAGSPRPPTDSHDLSKGYILQSHTIETAAAPHSIKHKQGPEGKARSRIAKGDGKAANQLQRQYGKDKKQAINIFRDRLSRQWPCQAPKQPSDYHMEAYIDVPQAMKSILPHWRTWWANRNFKHYLDGIVAALKLIPLKTVTVGQHSITSDLMIKHCARSVLSVSDVFKHAVPDTSNIPMPILQSLFRKTEIEPGESKELTGVVDFLEARVGPQYERRYLSDLRDSVSSLKNYRLNHLARDDARTEKFREYLAQCDIRHKDIYNSILTAVQPFFKSTPHGPENVIDAILCDSGFQPRISPVFILQQLSRSNWSKLSDAWKDTIIEYGLAVTALQRAKRLMQFQNDSVDLLRELENEGHQSWSPRDHPEWLLIECESEIIIRQVQQQIAQQMIQPPNDHNAVMQLNMGEGKSSVIVPIVSTTLGDGHKLVRIIVAKAQAKQMHQMLVTKLSGFVDRPVYQLPFSRDVRMDASRAAAILRSLVNCKKEGGILLAQPEHLLSLQLMELELELSNQSSIAEEIKNIRLLFEDCSRDLVDESDENFSTKFELIYTLGQQRSIEHSPDRWTIVQEVLGLLRCAAIEVKRELPQSIDLDEQHPERFPIIRILHRDAEKAIFSRMADFICETGIPGFPVALQPPEIRDAIRTYISKWKLSPEEAQAVEHSRFWDVTVIKPLLVLRGLLAGRILAFALGEKRWRVNYGLDLTREKKTRLAIPFKAKDNPTPRSEFSHPDIVIVLTCLSYYYDGLNDQALFECLELVIRSDNAGLEYQTWVQTAPTLSESYRHLQGINIKDRIQCTSELFPSLRYSKGAIDYYLCHIVFAKESKEFPHKLSASGWDLAKKKKHPTTGFSGTNDSRYVLPFEMEQLDLPEQKHTNALVLRNLLRPENSVALMTGEMTGSTFDSQSLLQMLRMISSRPRVILDVGAQITDLSNVELARAWLSYYTLDESTQAVVFFDDVDELVVLDKSGKIEELQTSPFADQLNNCLIFLDEVHTRGTDLKLPSNYQAAVTLGAHLTKDRLVQACMRMRKLGMGQSVIFLVPREIEHKIYLLRGQTYSPSVNITVSDVLCWAVTETCNDLRKAVPLWLSQGLRYTQQQSLWNNLTSLTDKVSRSVECAKRFMEDEAQSLERRYRPHQSEGDISSLIDRASPHAAACFRTRCEEFGLTEIENFSYSEEQERELSPEIEQERRVKGTVRAEPADHTVHPGLKDFIVNGSYPKDPFRPAFVTLETTSAAQYFDVSEFSNEILVTHDFARTVDGQFGPGNYSDPFQRPVQWVLTIQRYPNILVIVSPYEVQQLLSTIERSQHVTLHLFSPRVNLGYEPLENLDLYSLPKVTARQKVSRQSISRLCQFSGQLYLTSFDDYVQMCDSLGLAWKPANFYDVLNPDGFIAPDSIRGGTANKSGFSKSPVQFLKILMANIRQDYGAIQKTHMGKILEGIRLLESDFDA